MSNQEKQQKKKKRDKLFGAWMMKTGEKESLCSETPEGRLLDAAMFAANKHQFQKRKDELGTPYIVHPLTVAHILQHVGNVKDVDILIAAILHDTIEDTDATIDEIRALFGEKVAGYVAEVTDDKSLPKVARKKAQIEHVRNGSDGAKLIKMADKISNVWDTLSIPKGWTVQRARGYACWSKQVMDGARSVNVAPYTGLFEMLDKFFKCSLVNPTTNEAIQTLLPESEEEQQACLEAFYASFEKAESMDIPKDLSV